MFIYDKPIETEKDDFLGRKIFSQHLGKALLDWKEKESLVMICLTILSKNIVRINSSDLT